MSVSTIHTNALGQVVQVHEHASGARVSDGKGHHLDMRYDESTDTFVLEYSEGVNFSVETGSNKIWVIKR